jgi:uncharacterized protein (DUF2141 family)
MARPGVPGSMIRLVLLMLVLAWPAAAEPGVLEVTVTGIRNSNGHVLVAVCDRKTFLSPTCAYHGRASAQPGPVVVRITGIPAGVYAVEAYHDENDNKQLDRNFIGMPKEGMGFSRDAPMRFGPPDFADAAVTVPANGGAVSFEMRYFD